MKFAPVSAAVVTVALSLSGSDCKLSGHGGDEMTAGECKAPLAKGYALQETPESLYAPLVDDAAMSCADNDAFLSGPHLPPARMPQAAEAAANG